MKRFLALVAALLASASAFADGTFYGDNVFTTPGTLSIQSGVNLTGTWNFTNATVTGITAPAGGANGELQWNNTNVLSGLATITTDGVDVTTPASRFYLVDITDPTKKVRLNLSNIGTGQSVQVNVSNNSTTVIGDSGASNNFLTGINATTGAITKARPTIANLTDLSGVKKLVGSAESTSTVGELTLGANLSITGSTINAATGGVSDGDKGDISVTNGGSTWSLDNQVVTYAKMQNVTQNRILGRVSSGSGQVEELTGAQVTPLLSVFGDSAAGLVPASGGGTTAFLRADHTFAVPPGSGTVTTTGVPLAGHLTTFSAPTSITNVHNSLGVDAWLHVNSDDSITLENAATTRATMGAGTVTNFSASDGANLFTTNETNTTTTPALAFNMVQAPAHNYFGNNTASAGVANYHQPLFTDLSGTLNHSTQMSFAGPAVLGRSDGSTGGAQLIGGSYPISIGAGGISLVDGGVSNLKLRDSPALSVIGRSPNSSGDPGDITTTSGSNYVLREGSGTLDFGTLNTGGIQDRAVTLAKIQNASANARLVGSSATGSGSPYSELTPGKNLNMNSSTLDAGLYATGENQNGFSTDQYITSSRITMPAGSLTVGMMYHCTFHITKTAAGTGTITYTVRIGTAGTISDTAAVNFTGFTPGTAAVDVGIFEIWAYVRSSGASTVVVGTTRVTKNATTVGLMNTGTQMVVSGSIAGGSFNSSSATKIGVSFNGGTSFNGTIGFTQAELIEP